MIYIDLCNQVRNDADLVLTIGSRIGETDWWGKPPYWASPSRQKHIQVDNDEEILGLNKPVDLPILADAREFLATLLAAINKRPSLPSWPERLQTIERHNESKRKGREQLDKISLPPTTDDGRPSREGVPRGLSR